MGPDAAVPGVLQFLAALSGFGRGASLAEYLKDLNKAGDGPETLTPESVSGLWLGQKVAAGNLIAPIRVGSVRDLGVPAGNRQFLVRICTPAGH